jgi:hypothetical protein
MADRENWAWNLGERVPLGDEGFDALFLENKPIVTQLVPADMKQQKVSGRMEINRRGGSRQRERRGVESSGGSRKLTSKNVVADASVLLAGGTVWEKSGSRKGLFEASLKPQKRQLTLFVQITSPK